MITTVQLSKYFEDQINAKVPAEWNVSFKIWANVGEYAKALRNGNTVYDKINCCLYGNMSRNDASAVVAGLAGLNLVMFIPFNQPKTSLAQTEEELRTIKPVYAGFENGTQIESDQMAFPNEIIQLLDDYFQSVQTMTVDDPDGSVYGIGLSASRAQVTGISDSAKGRGINLYVYIEMTYIQGGDISQMIKISMLGQTIPYTLQSLARVKELQRSAQMNDGKSTSFSSSSAFSINMKVPAISGAFFQTVISDILYNNLNKSFFVHVDWAGRQSANYLMTLSTVSGDMEGIKGAGFTLSLVEAIPRIELLDFPENYRVGYYSVESSFIETLTVNPENSWTQGYYFIADNIYTQPGVNEIALTPQDIATDAEGNYRIYIVTDISGFDDENITWITE